MDDARTTSAGRDSSGWLRAALWAALAVALGLRVWEAMESSLWLDELHTLAHASLPTVSEVAENVRREGVHQPAFFVAVHGFGGWEQGASLRALPVLSSLLVLLPLLAFARSAGRGAVVVALAAWLFACLPYHVHYATELRPYAWLTVFSAGACWAAFSTRSPRWVRFALFFACVLLGMWTHRFMAVTVFSIGVARLFVRNRSMLPLTWLIAAGTLAVAPVVPWMLDFAQQATSDRFQYQDSRGGLEVRRVLVMELLQSPTRLFVLSIGELGGIWSWIARVATAVLFATLAGSLAAWWQRRRQGGVERLPDELRALGLFVVVDFALVLALSVYTWDRLPLQYFASLAWALPVFAALPVDAWSGRARGAAVALLAGSALALGVAQAGGKLFEDLRQAVGAARELGGTLQEPVYTALLSQPALFEDKLPYLAYGRDLGAVEPGEVALPGEPGFERPVIVLQRGKIPHSRESWKRLLQGRRIVRTTSIDRYVTLVLLQPQS